MLQRDVVKAPPDRRASRAAMVATACALLALAALIASTHQAPVALAFALGCTAFLVRPVLHLIQR